MRLFGKNKSTVINKINLSKKEEWPKIWCDLNKWDFGYFQSCLTDKEMGDAMKYIVSKCGLYAVLKEWNKNRMTDLEFEKFYNGRNVDNDKFYYGGKK